MHQLKRKETVFIVTRKFIGSTTPLQAFVNIIRHDGQAIFRNKELNKKAKRVIIESVNNTLMKPVVQEKEA